MKSAGVIVICLVFFSCRNSGTVMSAETYVQSNDTALHWRNGLYYFRQLPFSGHITARYDNDSLQYDRSYLDGKEEGWHFLYYPNGVLSERRYYHAGEKEGVHTGWWPDGKQRFEYHFSKSQYQGDFTEWYASGQLYKKIYYINGTDDSGTGWRENGKIYMSYVNRNGRRYGLVNSNLCYTLKNEKGEFLQSIPDSSVVRQ